MKRNPFPYLDFQEFHGLFSNRGRVEMWMQDMNTWAAGTTFLL